MNKDRKTEKMLKTILNKITELSDKVNKIDDNKKGRSAQDRIAIIISAVSMITSIMIPIIIYNWEGFNKALIFDQEKMQIEMEDNSSSLEFGIKQGGINKAYVATITSSGEIIYENISDKFDEKGVYFEKIPQSMEINIDEKEVEIKNINVPSQYTINGMVTIRELGDFALVLLDTTGRWSIYYIVSTPEYEPTGEAAYCVTLYDESGNEVGEFSKKIEKQSFGYIVIDGNLTNVTSIRNKINTNLKLDYHLFRDEQTLLGCNGEQIRFNPIMINVHDLPDAQVVYNNIIQIKNDIETLN